ncbi:MAG TPA: hypothetical protein VFZ33_17680 [Chitinophagaceae bacterium]
MEKEDLELRIKDAIVLLADGRSINVGDLTFGSKNKNHLSVTGWTRTSDFESVTKVSALHELDEIKDLFKRMTSASKILSDFIANKEIEFHLGYDYRMGAIGICTELNGELKWETDLTK